MRHSRFGFGSALAAVVLLLSGDASAQQTDPTKQVCVEAYDATQTARQEGALVRARAEALRCSQEQCPGVVKKDCAQWLAEIDGVLPTVAFAVKDATGADTTQARVFVDGALLLDQLQASAVPVDPGERTFRVEIAGASPREQRVVVREGEKARLLSFSFAAGVEPAGPPRPSPMAADADSDEATIPVASWVLGGVGIVGVGLFATFGALGLSEKSSAEDPSTGCAPSCTDDEVSSIRTKFLVADISLGVGLAALGTAVIVALVAGGSDDAVAAPRQPTLSIGAAPMPGGGFATAHGSF